MPHPASTTAGPFVASSHRLGPNPSGQRDGSPETTRFTVALLSAVVWAGLSLIWGADALIPCDAAGGAARHHPVATRVGVAQVRRWPFRRSGVLKY